MTVIHSRRQLPRWRDCGSGASPGRWAQPYPAPPRGRGHGGRSAGGGAPADAEKGLRLHRRGRRRRDLPGPQPAGLPAGRVQAERAPRCIHGGSVGLSPRQAVSTARRARSHRIHPDDAPRRRGGRGAGGGQRGDPLHAVQCRDHLGERPRGDGPRHPPLVSALPVPRSPAQPGTGAPRRGMRLRGTGSDRGHAGGGPAAARCAQRADHPAQAPAALFPQRGGPAPVVAQLPHHRPAQHGRPGNAVRHRRRAGWPVRPVGHDPGCRLAAGDLARQAHREGRAEPRGRGRSRRRRRGRGRGQQPWRSPARPVTGPAGRAAWRGAGGRRAGGGVRGRRGAVRRGRGGGPVPGGDSRADRPGLPLRADGRGRGRRGPGPRHSVGRDPPDHATPGCLLDRRAHPGPGPAAGRQPMPDRRGRAPGAYSHRAAGVTGWPAPRRGGPGCRPRRPGRRR